MPISITPRGIGKPDYTTEPVGQPRFSVKQDRLWGWLENLINPQGYATWIVWNAPQVPSGAPGESIYKPKTEWIIRDFVTEIDENSLMMVRAGVIWWDGNSVWVTGEVRGQGYQKVELKLSDGLVVHHSADLSRPYGFFMQFYNPDNRPKIIRAWINGFAQVTEYFPLPGGSQKLDLKNVIEVQEVPKDSPDYDMVLGVGNETKAFKIKKPPQDKK